jgi:hypothetical protein
MRTETAQIGNQKSREDQTTESREMIELLSGRKHVTFSCVPSAEDSGFLRSILALASRAKASIVFSCVLDFVD